MVVGGANTRVDFHDDPVKVWFYQICGDMMLQIAENGKTCDVLIREGEVFLIPARTFHAPQCIPAKVSRCQAGYGFDRSRPLLNLEQTDFGQIPHCFSGRKFCEFSGNRVTQRARIKVGIG